MRLAETEFPGDADAPPLVVAHGLFGAARNWRTLARKMAAGRRVIAVDMRNHAASPRGETQSYHDMAGDLAETVEAHGGRAAVLGHSMGGKAAMVLATSRPELVERLIVADIAPVAYGHSLRPQIAAMRAVDLAAAGRRSAVEAALAERLGDRAERSFLAQSADFTADPPRWSLNLDVLDAEMDLITGFPELDGVYEGPVLFLAGGLSDYLKPEHRPLIARLFPNARGEIVKDAGHWLHAEKPAEFCAAVAAFLKEGS